MKEIILVGGFIEIIELCELCGYKIIGVIDKDEKSINGNYRYLGADSNSREIFNYFSHIPVVITPDNPSVREKLVMQYRNIGFQFVSIISPNAHVSPLAQIGEGCIIQSYCNVSSNTKIGNFVKLNTYSNVMHDCVVEDFSTIAPNAVVLGYVTIGYGTYVGANSTIIERNNIGEHSIIGAGAVVNKNIESNVVAAGVPTRIIKKNVY